MGDIDHFLGQRGNLAALEGLEVAELLAGHAVLVVEVALVNDEFRSELVANFFLKLLKLRLKQIGWTADNRFLIFNSLLLYFLIKWLYSHTKFS